MSDAGTAAGPAWAIVLAAGSGRRFGNRSKQFEPVGGIRMVDRVVAAARRTCDGVVVVLPPGVEWDGEPVDRVTVGGDHASDTVRAGLAAIPAAAGVVVICDPAHPLSPDHLFTAVIDAVRGGADGAVPTLPIHEVIQRVEDGRVVDTIPKDGLMITQAPHAFRASVLRAVHVDKPTPPENSGLLVQLGYTVVAVPGDQTNLHITTPEELAALNELVGGRAAVG